MAITAQTQISGAALPDRPMVVEFRRLPAPLPSADAPLNAGEFEFEVAVAAAAR